MKREGCLRPGWSGGWQWIENGTRTAWVQLATAERHVRLQYRVRIGGGDWQDVDEAVEIVRMTCRLGGSRPYFRCPGVVNGIACGRRVVKLYGADRYFLCRHCYGLTHASQREDELDRARRRSGKIKVRLGGKGDPLSFFPQRPKGMWTRTYERLRDKAIDAEVEAEEMFDFQARRLLARLDRQSGKRSFWS